MKRTKYEVYLDTLKQLNILKGHLNDYIQKIEKNKDTPATLTYYMLKLAKANKDLTIPLLVNEEKKSE